MMFEYKKPHPLPTATKHDLQLHNIPSTPGSNFIFDIRLDKCEDRLKESVQKGIDAACTGDEAAMPDLLLWDKKGLRYFEEVTYSPTYYLTNEEIGILERKRYNIARCIKDGGMLVELGSGNLRKTKILLNTLDELGIEVDYFALDVSYTELQRTPNVIPPGTFKHIHCFGLLGTYDDCREWLERDGISSRSKTILSLGSTLGGFTRDHAAKFLASFIPTATRSNRSNVSFLIGLDGCKEADRVFAAYNDTSGVNHKFIKHGLERANTVLGYEAFNIGKWDVQGYWGVEKGCHNQFYVPRVDVYLNGLRGGVIPAGRRILAIQSHKYDTKDREALCRGAGLGIVDLWSSDEQYRLCYLEPV